MKKNLFTMSLLAWVLCLLLPARVMAQTEVDGLWYTFDESTKTAAVVQYQGTKYEGAIVIPSTVNGYSVTSIGEYAFYECYDLYSITIPDGVTSIEEGAFSACTGLNSITIPESVTSIGEEAFYSCIRLFRITIPEGVMTIGTNAFSRCSRLTSISIPGSVTDLGDFTFQNCTGLTSITISEGVRSIGYGTFTGCISLTSITIPESVITIGLSAFDCCSGLTSITIPRHVRSIRESAFSYCNLTSINVESGNPFFDSRENCNAIINTTPNELIVGCKNTIIPESVTSIGWTAFSGCSGLTSITIPEGVTEIGRYAFEGCSDLTSVTMKNPTPVAIESETFSNRANATLYVPAGSKAAYEAAEYWNTFKEIVEMEATTIEPIEQDEVTDFGENSGLTDEADLGGVIANNIYFNIPNDKGRYEPVEDCIVITSATSDEDMAAIEGKEFFDQELMDHFAGFIFKVPAGQGSIRIMAEATGNMTLRVKIGDNEIVERKLDGRPKVTIPYNVSTESLVYVYAGQNALAKGVRGTASELKIYSVSREDLMPGSTTETFAIMLDGAKQTVSGSLVILDNTDYIITDSGIYRVTGHTERSMGDVNGDDKITIADVTALVNVILGSGSVGPAVIYDVESVGE